MANREVDMDTPDERSRARARAIKELDGKTVWDVADMYAVEALVVLHEGLDSEDEKLRASSARDLAYVWSRLPPRPTAPPAKGMSAEEYEAALVAAEQDPAVRKWLVEKRGWTAPKEKGTSN